MKDENKIDAVTVLTEQYRADLKKYQDRESEYIQNKNKLNKICSWSVEETKSARKRKAT